MGRRKRILQAVESGAEQLPMAPFFVEGPRLGPRYRDIELLQTWPNVSVYRGVQSPLDRKVSIKVLHASAKSASGRRIRDAFLREAKLLSELQHPNLVAIHDLGETEEGALYVVSERLTGHPLSQVLGGEPLGVERIFHLAFQIATALEAAHENGLPNVVLRAENIMVVRPKPGGKESVKLHGFGLTDGLETFDAVERAPAGDVDPSPRLLPRNNTTPESEVRSFGGLLRAMLSGERFAPEVANAEVAQSEGIVGRTDMPVGLIAVARRCLAGPQASRYRSIAEVKRGLRDWYLDSNDLTTGRISTLQQAAQSADGECTERPPAPAAPRASSNLGGRASIDAGASVVSSLRGRSWLWMSVLVCAAAVMLLRPTREAPLDREALGPRPSAKQTPSRPPAKPTTSAPAAKQAAVPTPEPSPPASVGAATLSAVPGTLLEAAREAPTKPKLQVPPSRRAPKARAIADPPKRRSPRQRRKKPKMLLKDAVPSLGVVGEESRPQIGVVDED